MTSGARHRLGAARTSSNTSLLYLQAFALALFLVPSVVVISGPLKSNGSPAVILALGAFVLFGLAFLTHRLPAFPAFGPSALAVVAALELISWASGYTRFTDVATRAGILRGLIGLLSYTGVGLLTMLSMRRERDRRALLVVIVIGLIYDGVIGIIQGATSSDPRYLLKPPGFVLNRTFEPTVRAGYTRALGTSDSPIEFALLMACLIAISLYLVRSESSTRVRVLAGAGIVVGLLGIPSSVSRTGVVCLAAVVLVYLLVSRIRDLVAGAVGVGVLVYAYALAVPSRADKLLNLFTQASKDDSVTGRTSDYSVVYKEFLKRPLFGSGLGSNLPSESRYLDNQWLQATVEGGLIGILALAILFAAALAAGSAGLRLARHIGERAESVAYLAVAAAVFASSFTFDLFGFNQAKYLFFLVFGLAWAAVSDRRSATDPAASTDGAVSVAGVRR